VIAQGFAMLAFILDGLLRNRIPIGAFGAMALAGSPTRRSRRRGLPKISSAGSFACG
jgi:hypothetical protein